MMVICMADKFSKEIRSKIMGSIRSKDTSPERFVRRLIFAMGYRYRLHDTRLPGTPDLVFRSRRKVIFVHGCFWHQHEGCRSGHIPATNSPFWVAKLQANRERDSEVLMKISELGWKALVLWECQLSRKNLPMLRRKIRQFLEN